jgi:uncharacterized protein YndB with AHSA1/START domain
VTDLGQFIDLDGRPAVRFQRTYPHPIDRVWTAVTTPEELQHWFPSSVDLDLAVGAPVRFSGDPYVENRPGIVVAVDPPRHLAFTWGDDELRFDLEEVDVGSCRFTLTNLLSERDAAARNASGWAVCLGELDKHIDGTPSRGPHSDDALAFQPLYDAHISAGLSWGAAIPAPATED